MKIINKVLLSVMFIAAFIFQSDSFARSMGIKQPAIDAQELNSSVRSVEESKPADKAITAERLKLQKATEIAKKIKERAEIAIRTVSDDLENGKISRIEAAKKIGKHNHRIVQAEKKLTELTEKSINNLEEKGYLSQLIAPFKSGYGYTEEQKDEARAIIAQLREQMEEVTREHKNAKGQIKQQSEYSKAIQALENEIYNQQLITGDVMSTSRQLFWGAVALAGVVATAVLAKYISDKRGEITLDAQIEQQRELAEDAVVQQGLEVEADRLVSEEGLRFAEMAAKKRAEEQVEETRKKDAQAEKLVSEEGLRFAAIAAEEQAEELVAKEGLQFAKATAKAKQDREKYAQDLADDYQQKLDAQAKKFVAKEGLQFAEMAAEEQAAKLVSEEELRFAATAAEEQAEELVAKEGLQFAKTTAKAKQDREKYAQDLAEFYKSEEVNPPTDVPNPEIQNEKNGEDHE